MSRFLPAFLSSLLPSKLSIDDEGKIVSTQLLPSSSSLPQKGTGSFLKDVDKLVVCLFAAKGGIEKRGLDEREKNSFAFNDNNNNDDNNNWIEYLEDIGCKEKIMEIRRCIADTR